MASKTIRDLEAQLAAREQQLETIQADVEALRRALAIMREAEPEEEPPAKIIRNTIVDILQEAGKPIHYGQIHDQLIKRGIAVPGKDPRRNVGAHLSLDDRFEKQGGGFWALKSWKRRPSGPLAAPVATPPSDPDPQSDPDEQADEYLNDMSDRFRHLSEESGDDPWDDDRVRLFARVTDDSKVPF